MGVRLESLPINISYGPPLPCKLRLIMIVFRLPFLHGIKRSKRLIICYVKMVVLFAVKRLLQLPSCFFHRRNT